MKQFIEKKQDIVICGGGIAGLVLALALGKTGKKILICEKGKYLNPNGADVLKPSGISILSQLGLLPNLLKAEAQKRHEVSFFHNGLPTLHIDYRLQQSTDHFFLIPYQEVLAIVLEAIKKTPAINILMETELTDIEQDSDGNIVTVVLNQKEYIYPDIVIGADGINSKLRNLLGINAEMYFYPRAMYFNKFPLVNSVKEQNRLYVDDKNALAYFYPINNREFRTVLSFEKDEADIFFQENHLSELKKRLKKFVSCSHDAIEAITQSNGFTTFPLCRMNLPKYNYQNVVFIGNAAHSVHPISGQGMNLAIEDAWELFLQISKYYKEELMLSEALNQFHNTRHPISQAIANYADQLANSFGSKDGFYLSLNPKIQTSGRQINDLNAIGL